jgi:predicted peroxiredoxin
MKEPMTMAKYVFIESRDPFESLDTRFVIGAATALKRRGAEVMVFLAQNGALAARRSARSSPLERMMEAGVEVMADDFSLAERGIREAEMLPGVQVSNIDALVNALVEDGCRSLWH